MPWEPGGNAWLWNSTWKNTISCTSITLQDHVFTSWIMKYLMRSNMPSTWDLFCLMTWWPLCKWCICTLIRISWRINNLDWLLLYFVQRCILLNKSFSSSSSSLVGPPQNSSVMTKAHQCLGFIHCNLRGSPHKYWETDYQSLVRSQPEYCCSICMGPYPEWRHWTHVVRALPGCSMGEGAVWL